MKRSFLTLAVAGAFALPFAAAAQSSDVSLSENDFNMLDADRDGTISRNEWRQGVQQMQQKGAQQSQQRGMQQSQSSQQSQRAQQGPGGNQWVLVTITPVEQRIMDNQRREALFRALDGNGDGSISAVEAGLNVQLLNAFAQLDQDRNGVIERQEFASVHVQDGSQQGQASTQGQGQPSASAGGASSSRNSSSGSSGSSGN